MFPITDPSRAADIRMRRRRAVWLLAGIVVVPLVMVSGHSGGSGGGTFFGIGRQGVGGIQAALQQIQDTTRISWLAPGSALPEGRRDGAALAATGSRLAIDLPCAGSVAVVPEPGLDGRIYASLLDGSPARAAGLTLQGGDQVTLGGDQVMLGGACRHGSLDLVVQAAPATALQVTLTGGTDLRTGAFTGPVRLVQRGGGDVVVDAAGTLDVDKTGGGGLTVGRVGADLHLVQHGSGDTTIGAGTIGHADIDLSGDGDLAFGRDAHLGVLTLAMRGGDVTIPHLDGPAGIRILGSGDLAIANSGASDVRLSSSGSGDVSIAAGTIGSLEAEMHGSGDLSVQAVVGTASVRAGSASDVTLPHVTGRLDRSTFDD